MLKIRNPFPMIGKVYKYEFYNVSRILLPLYAILLFLALFSGLMNKSAKFSNQNKTYEFSTPEIKPDFNQDYQDEIPFIEDDSPSIPKFNTQDSNALQIKYVPSEKTVEMPVQYSFSYSSSNNFPLPHIITGALGLAFAVLMQIIFILSLVICIRRFKKGLFEEEAYLNLSLPVTIGEHLWGRFLCYFTWLVICFVAVECAFLLSSIRMIKSDWVKQIFQNFNNYITQNGGKTAIFDLQIVICCLATGAAILLFGFFIETTAHLFKQHKTLAKVITVVVVIGIIGKILGQTFSISSIHDIQQTSKSLWYYFGESIALCAIFMGSSHFILSKHLNLE